MYKEVQGFKNGKPILLKWKRIDKSKIDEWRLQHPNLDTYLYSVQSFLNESDNTHISDLYFDLDKDGQVELAHEDAKTLCLYFNSRYDIEPKIWFSGNKGFHIHIPAECIGINPDENLTKHYMYLVNYLSGLLKLKTVDMGVYTIPRQWRIPNTINPKSNLYKIPLSLYQLTHLSLEDIKREAQSPKAFDEYETEYGVISELSMLYKQAVDKYKESLKLDFGFVKTDIAELNSKLPPCVKYIFDNGGILQLGMRNRTSMVLSAYCKDRGMEFGEAQGLLMAWNDLIPENSSLTSLHSKEARITAMQLVLKTVYSSEKYHFSCGSIKACGVPEEVCKDCKSLGEEAELVDLSDYAKAEYVGKYICVEGDIIGKDKRELIIPSRVKGSCNIDPDKNQCLACPMSNYFNPETKMNERVITFSSKSKTIIDLVDSTAGHIAIVIQKLFGVEGKRCPLFKADVEYMNAQVVHIASKINYDFKLEESITRTTAILLEHGIELNRSYKMYGRVFQNPRTRAATFIIDKTEPLVTMLDTFNLSMEEKDRLKIFQPNGISPREVMDKIKEIHRVFRDSFIYVFGRDELILGTDLVFHSVRRFNFQKQLIRGWLDILIIGDTRQGKTEVTKKLMRYYQLGVMAAGESSSRTGLLYNIQMIQGETAWVSFGLVPRSSGYLVCVDEIHGMRPDDFREFTQARSDGVVDVHKYAMGSAKAETRLISIANARTGMSLASYGYPVQAITEVPAFQALEDVSRFDYAIGVRAGDVTDNDINSDVNKIESINNPYTRELCRDLILWLWTRKPEDIIISEQTEALCLDLAKLMSAEFVPDIPLVEAADIRHKIMRIATAIAGRTYNSPDNEHLVVESVHVQCAYDFLMMIYRSQGLDYVGFSEDKARIEFSDESREELGTRFMEVTNWQEVIRFLLLNSYFNKTLLYQACQITKEGADRIITLLLTNKLVDPARGGSFRKTASGRKFLRGLLDYGKEKEPVPKGDDF